MVNPTPHPIECNLLARLPPTKTISPTRPLFLPSPAHQAPIGTNLVTLNTRKLIMLSIRKGLDTCWCAFGAAWLWLGFILGSDCTTFVMCYSLFSQPIMHNSRPPLPSKPAPPPTHTHIRQLIDCDAVDHGYSRSPQQEWDRHLNHVSAIALQLLLAFWMGWMCLGCVLGRGQVSFVDWVGKVELGWVAVLGMAVHV